MILRILKYFSPLKINSTLRMSLNATLFHQFKKLKPGIVLDVGSKNSPYKTKIPHLKYLRLDIDESTSPDICCDIHKIKSKSSFFDTIIATEVLEHVKEPQKVINEIHRTLKKGGVCILSTRFMHPYHPDPKDYYRFTKDSLKLLFRNFNNVEIYTHGNRIQILWSLINYGKIQNLFLNIFNPLFAKINFNDQTIYSGLIIYAKK